MPQRVLRDATSSMRAATGRRPAIPCLPGAGVVSFETREPVEAEQNGFGSIVILDALRLRKMPLLAQDARLAI
jgi:hypothetical protein